MTARPRLGFLGVGWIGRHRLQAAVEHGQAEIVALADPSSERRAQALQVVPDAIAYDSISRLLEMRLDGIVIATPSALHAEQAVAALSRGCAVFCQKPLGRNAAETAHVVETARACDRLLGVDLSYRYTAAAQAMRTLVERGELGRIHALDLVFHNAYGPDGEWFYDRARSGGGCVIDLGVHLVDLALWLLGFPAVRSVDGLLFAGGNRLPPRAVEVEDFAHVQIELESGVSIRVACSWRLAAGRDAVIEATVYGTGGGVGLRNIAGSFYDFAAEHYRGTQTERLVAPPDAWGGRALASWIETLRDTPRFDPEADRFVDVARVLDAIYTGELAGTARRRDR